MLQKGDIKIFQSSDGNTDIKVKLDHDTVWLNLNQLSNIFGKNKSTISRHIKNIFESGELDKNSVVAKYATTASDGKNYDVEYFNLDMIISVGYRVNSKQATSFRIWTTKILKDHLVKGYSLNKNQLDQKGYKELENAINLVKKTLNKGDISHDEAMGLLDIVTNYTNSWLMLQNYDEGKLSNVGATEKLLYKLNFEEGFDALMKLKLDLISKGEATELFARHKESKALEGIFGNIYQTFSGDELYNSVEEKAAHLLYFIIKDHPFIDGNKRSGAFLFILFLAKNNILFDKEGNRKINDRALVAITLLIAESNPKDKEIMIKLLINLIN